MRGPGAGAEPSRESARDEVGATVPASVWAMGVALLVMVALMQLFVESYGKAVVRASLDDGVRRGSSVDGTPQLCESVARERLAGLLGGSMGRGVRITCGESDDWSVSHADVSFPPWLGGQRGSSFSLDAGAPKEHRP
jgi:hypothetical protein